MQITIIGAGTVGTFLATYLARAGEEVTLVVRAGTVPESGALRVAVEMDDPTDEQWAIVPAIDALSAPPDAVILAVQTQELATVAQEIAPHLGAATILTMQRAPAADAVVAASCGTEHIIGCLPTTALQWQQSGLVHAYQPGAIAIDTQAPTDPAVLALQRALQGTLVPDITAVRWSHLLLSLPQALAASMNLGVAALLEDRRGFNSVVALLRESTRVLESGSIALAPVPNVDVAKLYRLHSMLGFFASGYVRTLPLAPPGHEASPLLQHLRRGHLTEIDYLNGSIATLGEATGIATPLNRQVVALIHEVERTGRFLTPAETWKRLN